MHSSRLRGDIEDTMEDLWNDLPRNDLEKYLNLLAGDTMMVVLIFRRFEVSLVEEIKG